MIERKRLDDLTSASSFSTFPPPSPPPSPLSQALRSRSEGAALPLKQYHNSIKRELINAFSGGQGASLLDLACGRGGDIWKWFDAGLSYVLGVDLSPGEVAEATRRFDEATSKRDKAGNRGGRSGLRPCRLVAEFRECSTLGLEPFSAEPRPPSSSASAGGEREEGNGSVEASTRDGKPSGDGGGGEEENGQTKKKKIPRRRRRPRRRFDSVSCMFAAHYFCSSDAALSMFLSNVARNLRPVSCSWGFSILF